MSGTAFRRILWKEYRAQGAFWTSVLAAIALIDLALAADPWLTRDERTPTLFAVALGFATLYTLGSAATLFATERENGTYDFLRALPVGPWTVFFGKSAFAVASAAAMFGIAWLLARVMAGELPDGRAHATMWVVWRLISIEFLAWGILFSLLSRRTIVAAFLAGTAAAIAFGSFSSYGRTSEFLLGPLLFVGLVTANVALANRWLRERLSPFSASIHWARRERRSFSERRFGRLGRLVWQEMRQSRALTIVILATLLPFALTLWSAWRDPGWSDRRPYAELVLPALAAMWFASYFSPILLGSTAFLGDQTGYRFRYLAESGIPPRLVWLSRQIRGLAILLLLLMLLPVAAAILRPADRSPVATRLLVEWLLGYVAVAYACGQLCSMTIRSGILAVAVGAILTAVICGWAALVQLFGMSWLWTVAPLPVAFLAATWLHAPDWLVERRTWRARLRPALVIAVPVVAILAAIPPVRIYEIPFVDPGFDPRGLSWPISAEEKETLALYGQAYRYFDKFQQKEPHAKNEEITPAEERARQEDKAKAVALVLKASNRPLPGFYVAPPETLIPSLELELARPVLQSANALQTDGKLDAALDRYLAAMQITLHVRQRSPWNWDACKYEIYICEYLTHWSAQRGQKSERVLRAIRELDELWHTPPTYCDKIEYVYRQVLGILEGGEDVMGVRDAAGLLDFVKLARWLPWERARALRILNMLAGEQIARLRATEEALAAGGSLRDYPPHPLDEAENRRWATLGKDTVTYKTVRENMPPHVLDELLTAENCRRATRLVLALEAWKLDHDGSLPDSLDDLLGKYLDRIPVDPTTGQRFGYEPKGVDYEGEYVGESLFIKPGQPFVGQWPTRKVKDTIIMYYRDNGTYFQFSWGWTLPIP